MAKNRSRAQEKREGNDIINMELDLIEKKRVNIDAELQKINFLPGIDMKTENQKKLIRKIHENQIIFVAGPAGVGKTFVAIKAALECLKKNDSTQSKILITKPLIEGGDQSMGFLPGDIKDKTEPWMKSYEANIKKLVGDGTTKSLYANNVVKSLAFPLIRGNTFDNAIAILDEGQNTTLGGMKLFLSRIGETSKIIVLGDIDQTDLKLRKGEKSGLDDAFERFKGVPGVAYMEFTEDDIVRSGILIDLMKRYRKPKEG
jgi:phosphate starvation-inducible PhoH-like protein